MLWEIEILPNHADPEAARVNRELTLMTHSESTAVRRAARGFLVEGTLDQEAAERLMRELLVDPLVETGRTGPLNAFRQSGRSTAFATVLYKPGVMDPVADSVELAARDLDIPLESVRTFRRYYACGGPFEPERSLFPLPQDPRQRRDQKRRSIPPVPAVARASDARLGVQVPPGDGADPHCRRCRPRRPQQGGPAFAESRRDAHHPDALP